MTLFPKLRLALTLYCLGTIVLHFAIFWPERAKVLAGAPDFSIFYTAGLMIRDGQGPVLYQGDIQRRIQQGFAPAYTHDAFLPYNHPPFEALLYVGMTYLPYVPAYFLWLLVNLLLLGSSIYLLSRWLPTLMSTFPQFVYLVPLGFFPVAYALLQGQDSILLLALLCLAYSALRRERDLQAGVYLGLGLFKFHLVLPFAFILMLRRRWQALLGILISGCLETVVSWALVRGKELLYYPRYVLRINKEIPGGVIFPENMPNLRGLFLGWGWNESALPWLNIALIAASFLLLIWASRQWRAGDLTNPRAWNAGFSIGLLTAFLAGYHSYNHDLTILLLPVLLTGNDLLERDSARQNVGLMVSLGLMFLSPLYLVLTLQYFHLNLFALVLLGFAGSLAYSGGARPPTSAGRAKVLSSVPPV